VVIITLILVTFFSGFGWIMVSQGWDHVGYTWAYSVCYLLFLDAIKVTVFEFYSHVLNWARKHNIGSPFFKRIIHSELASRTPKDTTELEENQDQHRNSKECEENLQEPGCEKKSGSDTHEHQEKEKTECEEHSPHQRNLEYV